MFISSLTRCSLPAGSAFGNAIGATRFTTAALAETPVGAKASGIQPFTTHFPASDLVDLRHRIAATSWPECETVVDDSQGVQIATASLLPFTAAPIWCQQRCFALLVDRSR